MTIKLVAIDVDKTLLNSENQLTKKTIDVLKEAIAKGTKIVITSGRPLSGTKIYYGKLGIADRSDQYAINYNGAMIRTTDGNILDHTALSGQDYLDLYKLAGQLGVKIQAETADYIYTPYLSVPKYTKFEAKLVSADIKYVRMQTIKKNDQITKVMYIDEPERIDHAKNNLPQWVNERFTVVSSAPIYLEFISKNVSKGIAVKKLADRLNISQDQVMAIGDQDNDLSMIDYAGLGVAMGNGIDQVKRQADFVSKTNDEDGVAYAVDKFVLKEEIQEKNN